MKETHIILGLGGAGATIATGLATGLKADGINTEVYLFNTSKQDMKGVHAEEYFILGASEGCGKDRELGKRIAKDERDNIETILKLVGHLTKEEIRGVNINTLTADGISEIEKKVKHISSINVIFSNGGGTGSGISVTFVDLVKRLYGKTLPIFVNVIRPFEFETIPTVNAVNQLMEFSSVLAKKEVVFGIYDNNAITEQIGSTDFAKVNIKIVDSLKFLYFDFLETHSKAASSFNLDRRDFYRVVSQRGNSAGLINIYGFKKGSFEAFNNFTGLSMEYEGARKVLCVVRDSKHIKEVREHIKKLGDADVLEFKSLDFDNSITNNIGYDALVYAIGERKSDNMVDELYQRFQESLSAKAEVAKKDTIKDTMKEKGTKKVSIKF